MSGEPHDELPEIPELSGEYELIRELGRGGTAVVYLARDRDLGRDVAIKLIRPSFVQDEDAVARLVREARTVGKLQHPNIVMLLGTRRLSDGGLALILQYVPGRSLKDRLRTEGALPFEDCERILRDLGRALAYAHRSRIVHRDLKPENVYLDEGVGLARLADFGIARAWDSDSGLTMPGTAIGTPTYMSPEQVDGRDLDGRSDLYSLGLLGYEIVTGRQPWEGESLYTVIYKQKNEDLPSIASLRPDTPPNLIRAIEGATRKDPGDRWESAEAFLEVLASGSVLPDGPTVRGGDVTLRPVPESGRTGRPPAPLIPPSWTPEEEGYRPAAGSSTPGAGATPGAGNRPPGIAPGSGDPVSTPAGMAPEAAEALRAMQSERSVPHRPETETAEPPARRRRGAWAIAAVAGLALLIVSALAVAQPEGGVRAFVDSVNPLFAGPDDVDGDRAWIRETPPEPTEGADDPAPGDEDSETGLAASGEDGGFTILQGNRQSGPPGTQLPMPLMLRLVDPDGEGIGGVRVAFEVASGGGSVQPAEDLTRPDGSILTWWTLGSQGDQVARATAEGMEDIEAVFEASLAAETAPAIEVLGGTREGAPGTPLSEAVRVRLLDPDGRPMTDVPVRFTATGGSVEPAVARTDDDGVARTSWTLGSATGRQELSVQMEDRPGVSTIVAAEARTVGLSIRSEVVVGGSHTCSLGGSGSLVCWGGNDSGQLGDGSRNRRAAPASEVAGGPFAVVAAGVSHTCALNLQGETYCWGANSQRQLGTGGQSPESTPARVSDAEGFTRITAGLGHTCGLTPGGTVHCWGANDSGQLGDGSGSGRSTPAPVAGGRSFASVTAGWRHTCALDQGGAAYCWGSGGSGQLGHGEASSASTPRAVAGGHRFQHLAAGNAHTCGLTTGGEILCWGSNEHGQLGTGTGESSSTPVPIDGDGPFGSVTAGGVHSCGLTGDGATFCWGRNLHGQVGDGSTQDRAVPTRVAGNLRFARIESLGSHNCGRTPGGDTFCWGYNLEGQLGDGSRQNRTAPVPVPGARP